MINKDCIFCEEENICCKKCDKIFFCPSPCEDMEECEGIQLVKE